MKDRQFGGVHAEAPNRFPNIHSSPSGGGVRHRHLGPNSEACEKGFPHKTTSSPSREDNPSERCCHLLRVHGSNVKGSPITWALGDGLPEDSAVLRVITNLINFGSPREASRLVKRLSIPQDSPPRRVPPRITGIELPNQTCTREQASAT